MRAVILMSVAWAAQAQPVGDTELPRWQEKAKPKATRSGVSRYSPLAASGGYQGTAHTWYDTLFASLNPHGIDWGAVWERRRGSLRRQALVNGYFWTCAGLVLGSLLALFGWHVAWSDRRIAIVEAERQIGMLGAEADEWRTQAETAIAKYNIHIEKCNLVAETLTSGMDAPEMSDYVLLRRQFDKLVADRADKVAELGKLNAELEREKASARQFTTRIEELEKHASGPVASNQALVERINRLEEDLRLVRDENKRLKARRAVNS